MFEPPPERIDGAAAWRVADLLPGEWLHVLTPDEIAEVEAAARILATEAADLAAVGPKDFPAPRTVARLQSVLRAEVLGGRGFAVIRGLDPDTLSRREIAAAFLGLGSHLGALRPQNAKGHLLGHVKDLGRSSADPTARLYQTHERQTYHTDSCDVVALICLRPAKAGGRSSLVSSVSLYNEMRRRAPELALALFEPIATDRRGEAADGQAPFFTIPVFNWHAGRFAGIYQRQYIESAQRFPDAPHITAAQHAALDLLDALAEDSALHLEIDFEPGDIQLANNQVLFHDRTAFEDWPEPERRRHLLRLWLAPAEAQPLPAVFAERFGSVVPGARGGVWAPRQAWNAPLDVTGD